MNLDTANILFIEAGTDYVKVGLQFSEPVTSWRTHGQEKI
jgi:hypothetical protein